MTTTGAQLALIYGTFSGSDYFMSPAVLSLNEGDQNVCVYVYILDIRNIYNTCIYIYIRVLQ